MIILIKTRYLAQEYQGTKIFQYCTCPEGQVSYNFHSSCKNMHLSFKKVCNQEHMGVIYNMTSSSNSSQSTLPTVQVCFGKNTVLVLSKMHSKLQADEWNFVPWIYTHGCTSEVWLNSIIIILFPLCSNIVVKEL